MKTVDEVIPESSKPSCTGDIPDKAEDRSHEEPTLLSAKSVDPSHTNKLAVSGISPAPSHTLEPHGKGWRVRIGDLTVDLDSPHFDRGSIRGTLTVQNGTTVLHRDTVNLTSHTSRTNLLKSLSDLGVDLGEDTLMALDEACRHPEHMAVSVCDGGLEISETQSAMNSDPSSSDGSIHSPENGPAMAMADLQAVFKRWLLLADDDYLPIFTGAVLAHRLTSDPVWLMIVAPPGGTKTEMIASLYEYPGIYPLSKLTARTLASGFGNRTDASLLSRLTNEILVLKDFTTVLEISHDERQAILAQLREVYDGRLDATWGTGGELHWEGRLGFLAGVTQAIDKHQQAMALLGERFVLFRPRMADRAELALCAVERSGQEVQMRPALRSAMHRFLRARGFLAPIVDDAMLRVLASLGDFVTRARSPVERDANRNLSYAPEPEAPTRFTKVLKSLAQGIALAHDAARVTEREMRLIVRVAFDSLPPIRRAVLLALSRNREASVAQLAEAVAPHCSSTSVRRALEDLQALGVVQCVEHSLSGEHLWKLIVGAKELSCYATGEHGVGREVGSRVSAAEAFSPSSEDIQKAAQRALGSLRCYASRGATAVQWRNTSGLPAALFELAHRALLKAKYAEETATDGRPRYQLTAIGSTHQGELHLDVNSSHASEGPRDEKHESKVSDPASNDLIAARQGETR